MDKAVWTKLAEDIDAKATEPPFKLKWPVGEEVQHTKSPHGIGLPDKIEPMPPELAAVAKELDTAKEEYNKLLALIATEREKHEKALAPMTQEQKERETRMMMMAQQLGALLQGKTGVEMRHFQEAIIMVKRAIEKSRPEPTAKWKLDKLEAIVKAKLGPAAEELLLSLRNAIAGWKSQQQEVVEYDKQVTKFKSPEEARKRFVGSKEVEADAMAWLKNLFTGMWNKVTEVIRATKMVRSAFDEIIELMNTDPAKE